MLTCLTCSASVIQAQRICLASQVMILFLDSQKLKSSSDGRIVYLQLSLPWFSKLRYFVTVRGARAQNVIVHLSILLNISACSASVLTLSTALHRFWPVHFGSFHKLIICVFYFGQKSLECSPLVPQKFTLLSVLQRTSQQCGFSSCVLLGSGKAVVSSRVKRAVSSALLNMQMRFTDSMPVPLYPTVV